MSRKRDNTETVFDMFWDFVRENPQLAAALAFELGSLAGSAVKNSAGTKKFLKNRAKKVPQAIADAVPDRVASALKFLPAPKIQPRKRSQTKRAPRKASDAA